MLQLPYKLVLGSKSPRRQELLKGLGFEFEVRVLDTDESYPADIEVEEIPAYIAQEKGDAFLDTLAMDELVVTADTLVVLGDEILGKPVDRDGAIEMLQKLSGNTHQVITGVCLTTKEKTVSFSEITEVNFKELTEEEIIYYVDNYKPFDKAGSYGIQEWIGYVGIHSIVGCYYNVMGLPVSYLFEVLNEEFKTLEA